MDNIQITKDCVQSINNIGSTIYQNICNGELSVVPWGSGDWIGISLVALLTLTLFGLLIYAVSCLVND